jgi:hypothetical protein
VDLSRVDDDFVISCFNGMQNCLRFNICNLETSYLSNNEIPNLISRVEQAIPQHLSYACHFWADHLCASSLTPNLLDNLLLFLKTQFLHWLEAMSLMGAIAAADSALRKLQDISTVSTSTLVDTLSYRMSRKWMPILQIL